jgi:hypothetical protein
LIEPKRPLSGLSTVADAKSSLLKSLASLDDLSHTQPAAATLGIHKEKSRYFPSRICSSLILQDFKLSTGQLIDFVG